MPLYDTECDTCHTIAETFQKWDERETTCACGGTARRVWLPQNYRVAVIDDSWPGGRTFENLGHEPVTCYSRSEFLRELDKRGLEPKVRHQGEPGSDRSRHTTRWI